MIYVCSPYRGDVKENVEKAKSYCRLICNSGQLPIAPHLYFTQFLDDDIDSERNQGMTFGLELLELCDEVWVFGKYISAGMKAEIDYANQLGKKVKNVRC